jgi:hypothetical protein
MADGFNALGRELGAAIGGGGDTAAYDKALRGAYQAEDALQQARRSRSLALIDAARQTARGGITPDLVQRALGGDVGAQAELGAAALGSNQTVNLGQLGDYQQPRYGEAQNIRFEGLLGDNPDPARANRATAYVEGEDYQPTRVLGGAFVPDAMAPDDIRAIPTPQTLANIEATERRADAAVARSNRAPAARGGGDKPPTTAQAEAAVLAQARDAIAKGADPAQVKARMKQRGYTKLADKL